MRNSINISDDVRAVCRDAISIRRKIHQYPEPGFQEKRTGKLIRDTLRRAGVGVKGMVGTGTVGLVRGARPGRTLLVRADMDALPVQEQNRVPYRSRRAGLMHACGHDGHVAISLMAARVLQKRRGDLRGNVKFMFQPAEEGPGGAVPMLRAGILRSPKVDAAIALHLWNSLAIGKVGVREGPVFASVDQFDVVIRGRGGHGAAPHQTIDPVVVGAHVVTNLQTIVSRRIDPVEACVVTVGSIEGGMRHNIIPETAKLCGTVRSFDPRVRGRLKREIERVLRGVTRAHGATYTLDYHHMYPATRNDDGVTEFVRGVAGKVVGRRNVVLQAPAMGAEDMSYVLQKVPGCYLVVGSANRKKGLNHPHHSGKFDFDEEAIPIGIEIIVRTAGEYLQ